VWAGWRVVHGFVLLSTLLIAIVLTLYSLAVYLWEWRRVVRSLL
jgi:hypothetical protein